MPVQWKLVVSCSFLNQQGVSKSHDSLHDSLPLFSFVSGINRPVCEAISIWQRRHCNMAAETVFNARPAISVQLYNIHGEFLEINHATRRGDYSHWWKHPTPWAVICAKASESLSIRRAAVHGNGRGQKIFLPGGNFATLLQYQLASQGQGNDMLPQNCKDGSYRMPMASHLSKWYLKQKKKELYKDIRDPLCCCFFFPLREVIFQTTPSIFTALKKKEFFKCSLKSNETTVAFCRRKTKDARGLRHSTITFRFLEQKYGWRFLFFSSLSNLRVL